MVTRIMPLGDSNTYGMYQNWSSPGGYRGPLQNLLRDQDLSFDFVGLDKDGRIPDADHNGYSGKPIDWFTRPVDQPIRDRDGSLSHTVDSGSKTAVRYFIDEADLGPTDVVLLLAGTNDVRLGDSAQTMLAQMTVLLDQIVTHPASPMVQLMKLPPINGDRWADGDPTRTNNDTIRTFNEGLERLVDDKYGALGVTLVESGVTLAGLSSDGVHMNEAGHRAMAAAWHKSLMAEGQVDPLPKPPTGGADADTIVLKASGDAWQGDPAFALFVNGVRIDASTTVTADRADGEWQTFTFTGDFNLDGTDRAGVRFLNDRWGGSASRDRNLYVEEVRLNGEVDGTDHAFLRNSTEYWDF